MSSLINFDPSNMVGTFQQWRTTLNNLLRGPKSIATPKNVTATPFEGGISVTWGEVKEATGYEVHISSSGSFDDTVVVPLNNVASTSYSDSIGATPTQRFYSVFAVTGSMVDPTGVKSKRSLTVTATSKPFPQLPNGATTVIGPLSTTSTTAVSIPGLSKTINVLQNPSGATPTVLVILALSLVVSNAGSGEAAAIIIRRDSSDLQGAVSSFSSTGASALQLQFPVAIAFIDTPGAGSHTYSGRWNVDVGTTTASIASGQSGSIQVIQIQ